MDDTEDLEALFDSIVEAGKENPVAAPVAITAQAPDQTVQHHIGGPVAFAKIGHMTRSLFDALHELGYDKSLEKVVVSIPDANDRLAYIANLTQQAAERVLNATEVARPIQDGIGERAEALSGQWQKVFENKLSIDEFKELAMQTRNYLNEMPGKVKATNEQLTEIMMAQDFQDLTGQVIKKVVDIVRSVESQLLQLLIENSPQADIGTSSGLMNGPVVNPEGRLDVVTNQAQVDELLESLGF